MSKAEEGLSSASAEIQGFSQFAQFLQDACGIHLGQNKQYLVSTRINRILKDNSINSLKELLSHIEEPGHSSLRTQIIDAMTTNETYWFRDTYPFEYLKDNLIPLLINAKEGQGDIRIWSAACSTGQEPYSLSIIAGEHAQKNASTLPIKILGTDLSSKALETAESGIYDKFAMARGLSSERVQKFFKPLTESTWSVKPEVKQRVEFRSLNLLESFNSLGRFDVIFCRNVLIYFSTELKRDILIRLHGALKPGGFLCLGSSEGLSNIPGLFEMVQCDPGIFYRAR